MKSEATLKAMFSQSNVAPTPAPAPKPIPKPTIKQEELKSMVESSKAPPAEAKEEISMESATLEKPDEVKDQITSNESVPEGQESSSTPQEL